MSLDEDELLKLLNDDENGPTSENEGVVTTTRRNSLDSTELEQELVAMLENPPESDAGRKDVECRELCPVTPEDVKESQTMCTTHIHRKPGKDSSTDASSVEDELHGRRMKRSGEQGTKPPSKKTRYYETDNTVREPGWAVKMLENTKTIRIPQVTIPTRNREPLSVAKKPVYSKDTRVHGNGNGNGKPMTDTRIMPSGWLECPGLEGKMGIFLFSKVISRIHLCRRGIAF